MRETQDRTGWAERGCYIPRYPVKEEKVMCQLCDHELQTPGGPLSMPSSQQVIDAWDKEEIVIILNALSSVDAQDLDYLESRLGHGGRDEFWRATIARLRSVFEKKD